MRVARRFDLGTDTHGYGNYLRAFAEGSVDIGFLQDRYNHAMEHLTLLGEKGSFGDDHISAVVWFCNLAHITEEFGLDWADIMAVVTPEEAEALKDRIMKSYKGRPSQK